MQMTVISEGLLLNSKYIIPLVLFAMRFDGYPLTALRP